MRMADFHDYLGMLIQGDIHEAVSKIVQLKMNGDGRAGLARLSIQSQHY